MLTFESRLGDESANGFLDKVVDTATQMTYAMKSTAAADSDNLLYEYFAGQYINDVIKRFPEIHCFLHTYALFYYKSTSAYQKAKAQKLRGEDVIKYLTRQTATTFNFKTACTQPTNVAIMIEYAHGKSLKSYLRDAAWVERHLLDILVHIYTSLAQLADEFTHYDLHDENVLILKDIKKKTYTPKLIDYGRSFFHHPTKPAISSEFIHKKVCEVKSCNSVSAGSCGSQVGFQWLESHRRAFTSKTYFINSGRANYSHDLRLLKIVREQTNSPLLRDLLARVVYESEYGTPPRRSQKNSDRIVNVMDAAAALTRLKEKQDQK